MSTTKKRKIGTRKTNREKNGKKGKYRKLSTKREKKRRQNKKKGTLKQIKIARS